MEQRRQLFGRPLRRTAIVVAAVGSLGLVAAGCGSDGDDSSAASTTGSSEADLTGIKAFLTDHTADLATAAGDLDTTAQEYQALVDGADGDYDALVADSGEEVAALVETMKEQWQAANPAYEEAEGIVAGVPSLAQYDVDIDAGAAGTGEDGVSFDLELADGSVLERPGNLFFITETAIWGTNPEYQGTKKSDTNADGKDEFGESVPDAAVLTAATGELVSQTQNLDSDANAWEPTESDVFTALTVMIPTMSEYFEQWKNSRSVSGDDATEQGFVGATRLSDVVDILSGLDFTYEGVTPLVATEDEAAAEQTAEQMESLITFVTDLRDEEEGGRQYTPEEADTLGTEAQERAETIAGQITQQSATLGIELQEG